MAGFCPLVSSGGGWDTCRGPKCELWDDFGRRCCLKTVALNSKGVRDGIGKLMELGKEWMEMEERKVKKHGHV